MRAFVPSGTQRLLEIGCGAGRFVAGIKSQRPLHATGIEMIPDAARAAREVFDQVLEGSVEEALPKLLNEPLFDCIVANDVLEHLVDPWAVLRALRPLLAPGGCLVASLPNVRYWPNFNALALHGRWDYQDTGVLDRTHLRFFTQLSLPRLFEPAGYQLQTVCGVNETPLPWKAALLNRLIGGRLSDARFKQFACVATAASGRVK